MSIHGWFFWFAWRELWSRRWRTLLALLALALSVGLVVATGSIGALMQASIETPTSLIGQPADLWISSAYDVDYDLTTCLVARVAVMPGVAEVQPVLRRPVRGYTPRSDTLSLLGVEPASYFASHALSLSAGELPTAESPGLVALAPWAFVRELGLDDPITVTTASGSVVLPVTGLLKVENLAAAQQGVVLYAPLETVAELFGVQDVATALEVRLTDGADFRRVQSMLEENLGPAYAVSATSRSGQGPQLWQRLVLGTLVSVDLLCLTGSAILVYAVSAAAAPARKRQVGLLRVSGAHRQQVLALLATEAMLLALIGSGLGLVLGTLFAGLGTHLVLPGASLPAIPPLPAAVVLVAIGTGILSALAGALGPTLQAASASPLNALVTNSPQVHPTNQERGSGGALSHLVRHLPVASRLAISNLLRERRRSALIVAALAGILVMALGNTGVISLLGHELSARLGRLTGGDYLVLPSLTTISLRELAGQDTSDVPPLDPGLLSKLESLEVRLMAGTTADIAALQVFAGQPTLLLDVEGYAQMGGFRFQDGDWASALGIFHQGPAVLLAPAVARRLSVDVGDRVQLDTQRGTVDFQVAGIGDSEFTTCIMDLADGVTYFGANEVSAVLVQVRPGAGAREVEDALVDAIQAHGATLAPLGEVSAQLREVFAQMRRSMNLLVGFTGLIAGLGVVNAMLASVVERRREIGLLRAVGATRRQIEHTILVEMLVLGELAALLGTGLGWALTILFLGLGQAFLGFAYAEAFSIAAWRPLLLASLAGLIFWPALAVLGGLVPALHAARLPIVRALHKVAPG